MRMCSGCKKRKCESDFISVAKTRNTGVCRACKNRRDREYRARHKDEIARYYKDLWRESPERRADGRRRVLKHRFGFDVDAMRATGCCAICGMTNDESKVKYHKALSIDHINNCGRSVKTPDNRIENLQLLCSACHTRKTNTIDRPDKYKGVAVKIWRTRRQREEVLCGMHNGEWYEVREFAGKVGLSTSSIYRIYKQGKIILQKRIPTAYERI
jgi:5-methylcytosine-specific restriction endonuclease McrA